MRNRSSKSCSRNRQKSALGGARWLGCRICRVLLARTVAVIPFAARLMPVHLVGEVQLGGATAEVIDNPRDGMWIVLKFIKVPEEPALEGTEELVFWADIVGEADA